MSGQEEVVDLAAALRASVEAAMHRREQAELDRLPCKKCGGDRLRPDFTGSNVCHALSDTAAHDEWKAGDPCATCGSADTHLIQGDGVVVGACNSCGSADDDE